MTPNRATHHIRWKLPPRVCFETPHDPVNQWLEVFTFWLIIFFQALPWKVPALTKKLLQELGWNHIIQTDNSMTGKTKQVQYLHNVNPITPSIHKMVIHTLKTLQHFLSVYDNFIGNSFNMGSIYILDWPRSHVTCFSRLTSGIPKHFI